jgi:molybdopterin-guanine dinucleotide biosynthesis protein A
MGDASSSTPPTVTGGGHRTALIVLAGGRAERLGGASKPEVRIGDTRMLDLVLAATTDCDPRVVVAPESVHIPAGTFRTLENPPFGGPVAGIAAGLTVLARLQDRPPLRGDVLLLGCDMPGVGPAVTALLVGRAAQKGRDGVIATHADGRREMLAVVARDDALLQSIADGGSRDRSVRSLLAPLDLEEVLVDEAATRDVDTWEDHAWWEGAGGTTEPTKED